MRRFAVVGVAVFIGVLVFAPSGLAASARVAALQVGLRAHGFDPGPIDGVRGQLTTSALLRFQKAHGIRATGLVGRGTRRALRVRGRPLLGQRELGVGSVGWDVAVLEFRLRRHGLGPRAVDGRFTRSTGVALRRYQSRRGLSADGIAGPKTYRSLAGRSAPRVQTTWHVVRPGESFFSIAARYHVSPWRLARRNRLSLMTVIVPDQRLALPGGARLSAPPAAGPPASRTPFARRSTTGRASTASIRRWLARSPGWSRVSSRTSSRASERSVSCSSCRRRGSSSTSCCSARGRRGPTGKRARGRPLPALAARRVRGRSPARSGGVVPGSAGGARGRALQRDEGVRPDRARALRHGLRLYPRRISSFSGRARGSRTFSACSAPVTGSSAGSRRPTCTRSEA